MKKFTQSLGSKEPNNFIKRVMSDKNIHEIWETKVKNQEESATSILCDLRGEKSLKKVPPLEMAREDSKVKMQNLEEEINKKTMELTCYKSKFCETIQNYEKKIKDLYDLLLNTIMNVNEILRQIKIPYTDIDDFDDSQEFLDSNPELDKIEEYLNIKFPEIFDELQSYKPNSEYSKQVKNNEKQSQQIQTLIGVINKNNELIEKLKNKITDLRGQRNQLRIEKEINEKIQKQSNELVEEMELKYMNRKELTNTLKQLLKRILTHEKACKGVQKIGLPQIQSLSKKKSIKSKDSMEKYNEKQTQIEKIIRESNSPTFSKPPLSPTKRKRI